MLRQPLIYSLIISRCYKIFYLILNHVRNNGSRSGNREPESEDKRRREKLLSPHLSIEENAIFLNNMRKMKFRSRILLVMMLFLLVPAIVAGTSTSAHAQDSLPLEDADDETLDEALDEGLFADALEDEEEAAVAAEEEEIEAEEAEEEADTLLPEPIEEEEIEGGEAGEGQNRWGIQLNAAIIMNYVFDGSPDSFVIRYTVEMKGQANAATAIIRGEADITATVEGALSRWPTGECALDVTVPKVPFEITFRRTDEEQASIKAIFKRKITEDWKSTCSFTDAPGRRFETTGPPEEWLTKALEKTTPPLRSLIVDVGDDETTTTFVISVQTIPDPPVGSAEIEGTGVVTITPGGE